MPGCSPQRWRTRTRVHPRATSPTPHRRDPRTARSHRPSAADLTFGSVASSPREGHRASRHRPWDGSHHGITCTVLSSPRRPGPHQQNLGATGMLREAGARRCPGRPPLPPLSPRWLRGGLIFEALTPPLLAAPAAVPSTLSPSPCRASLHGRILEMVVHRGAGAEGGSGGSGISPSPALESR